MKSGTFEKLKQLNPKETPRQKLVPVTERKRDSETCYSLWLDKDLMKELKLMAVEQNTNVKKIVEAAIRAYLSS